MNLPNIMSSLNCCPSAKAAGGYPSPCACPIIQMNWATQTWSASMFGFSEWGTQSQPPVFYLTYVASGSGETYTNTNPQTIKAVANGFTGGFNASTGVFTSGTDDTVTTTPGGSVNNWVANSLNLQYGGNNASGVGVTSPMSDILTFQNHSGGALSLSLSFNFAALTTAQGSNRDLKYTAVANGGAGNNVTVAYVNPGTPSAALNVSVLGNAVTVSLATNSSSVPISTASQVLTAVQGNVPASALVGVALAPGSSGAGTVAAMTATNLSAGGTIATLTQAGWTNTSVLPHSSMSAGTFIITLTTPCTQADAVSAASPPGANSGTDDFGTGGASSTPGNDTSLFESLILNGWSFLKVLLTFGFYLQGLIAGQNYTLTYLIYQRTASNDGSGTPVRGAWTLYATDTISFTASGATYSTATTYSLPNAVGYEYQVQFAYLNFA